MTNSWDPNRVKTLLRLTAQKLGQLQDRKDSHAQVTSRDIATLLGQKNVALARNKAQNLMKDEAVSNAMELLEMYCGMLLEGFSALENDDLRLSPSLVEAASSIIYAAAFNDFHDLASIRDILMSRLGPDFSKAAMNNRDGYVPPRLLHTMQWSPSANELDDFLLGIAKKHGVEWKPKMRQEEKISALSEILDTSDVLGNVDMERLRIVASTGIPPDPSWLRPRAWKILLGLTPTLKAKWSSAAQINRDSYYDLVRRLLQSVASSSLPLTPLSSSDQSLLALIEALARVPAHLFYGLEEEVEPAESCPIAECARPEIRIECAFALDTRLQLIQDGTNTPGGDSYVETPEIRLESGSGPSSPTKEEGYFDLPTAAQRSSSQPTKKSKTLSLSSALAPRAFRGVPAHPTHVSVLLRLLYIHKALNPGSESPHLASLLVPLYVVTTQEADPNELAHAEADAFWMFEKLLQEVSELEESEGGLVWMGKLRERVRMTDNELLEDLTIKGLDPALPQYSYRWLSPLLSLTLPLPAVLMTWDTIFAQSEMSRSSNPKLEHLVDICAAMLVRARVRLLLLGNNGSKSPSLWDLPSPGAERPQLRPWELGDAFMEGMTLLQNYPIKEAGGIERILQVAGDIHLQREQLTMPPQATSNTFGAKIAETVWRGFTNQSALEVEEHSPEDSEEEEDTATEVEETETENESTASGAQSSGSGWGSYLKTTVMRGLTNQSAMESVTPNSLSPAASPQASPRRTQEAILSPPTSPPTSPPAAPKESLPSHLHLPSAGSSLRLWSYAEKLKQSDVAASLSKASTNISAKAMDVWTARHTPKANSTGGWREVSEPGEKPVETPVGMRPDAMTPTLRIDPLDTYSPPPRPAHFKPPRDTRLFSSEELAEAGIPSSPASPASTLTAESVSSGSGHSRTDSVKTDRFNLESLSAALPSWATNIPIPVTPKPKSAPRPLLLGTSTGRSPSPSAHISRSMNSTPTPDSAQWADVMRSKAVTSPRLRDSLNTQTSTSSRHGRSLTSGASGRIGSDSDMSVSRIVPLNRQSVSPMAPAFRLPRMKSRETSLSSASEFGLLRSPKLPSDDSPTSTSSNGKPNKSDSRPDSPSTLPSSPPPRTPVTSFALSQQANVRVTNPDSQRQQGSLVLSESSVSAAVDASSIRKNRKTPPTLETVDDTSDSSAPVPSALNRSAHRVRSKRFGKPTALRTRDIATPPEGISPIAIPINTNSPSTSTSSASTSKASLSLGSLAAPDFDSDAEPATTPRASVFPSSPIKDMSEGQGLPRSPISPRSPRRRKVSGEGRSARPRKNSGEAYTRRESQAHDGDDEGYDELLSSYESEAVAA